MSTPLRVAVIGCGLIARLRHLPAFLECQQRGLVRIVGLCDTDPQSLAQAASLVGDCPQFSDYQTLLESLQPDLVAICTPPVTHAPIALAALAAGAHVFCEKPLATTVAEAQEMVAAAVRSGRRTGVNFRYRWIPAARFARDIIQQGDLGPLTHLYLKLLQRHAGRYHPAGAVASAAGHRRRRRSGGPRLAPHRPGPLLG
jgi:predicted dehydrogenase